MADIDVSLYTKESLLEINPNIIEIEIAGLKSVNKFIYLEDTPLYYENGKFLKVENNRIIYADVEWENIQGDIEKNTELIEEIQKLSTEISEDVAQRIADETVSVHNLNEESHPFINDRIDTLQQDVNDKYEEVLQDIDELSDVVEENYSTLDNKIDTTKQDLETSIQNLDTKLSKDINDLDTKLSKDIDDLDIKLSQEIFDLNDDLNDEIVAREEADTGLQNQIDINKTDSETRDSQINARIDNEIQAREEADSTLQGNIDTLTQTELYHYSELDGRIEDLSDVVETNKTDSESRDTALGERIDSETKTREESDNTLQSNIDDLTQTVESNYSTLDSKIDDEIKTRTNDDIALGERIDAEVKTRGEADATLQNNIYDLSQTVISNYNTLDGKIDSVDTRLTEVAEELNQSIENNVIALQQEDTALQNQINTHSQEITQEITDRQTADNNLQEQITTNKNDISDLTQTVQDDYEELKGLVDKEIKDRSDADTTLQNNINDEIQARKDADDELQDQIDNLKARGRFLALWDASTGLAQTDPTSSPYIYNAGDYFIVGKTGDTNYRPTGTQYVIGQASTEIETDELTVDDVYYFDGNIWHLQINHGKTVNFANLAGEPSDNTNLKQALDSKQDVGDYATNTALTEGLALKQDNINDLENIRSNATAGKNASDIIDTYGDIVTHNVDEFQVAGDYATNTALTEGLNTKQDTISDLNDIKSGASKGATSVQPNDNISTLRNDAGYITKDVNNLTNYTTTENLNTELDKKQDNITDIDAIRNNATAGKNASDTINTYGDIVTHNTNEFQPAGDYATNTALTEGLKTKQDTISDLSTIRNNANNSVQYDIPTSKGLYLSTHAELSNRSVIIPFIHNDIAFFDQKGGTLTFARRTEDGEFVEYTQSDANKIINGKPDYCMPDPRGYYEFQITLEFSEKFLWGNVVYIDFGATSMMADKIKVEYKRYGDDWVQHSSIDNSKSVYYTNISGGSTGVVGLRFTLRPQNTTAQYNFRIAQIGLINFNSQGSNSTLLGLGGGTLYGDVTFASGKLVDYVKNIELTNGLATKQNTLVSGTNIKTLNNESILGSGNIEVKSAPDLDNKTISLNADNQLQSIGSILQSGGYQKYWQGTKAEYEAIQEKDPDTLYEVLDDIVDIVTEIPTATVDDIGLCKPDGTSITIDDTGTLSIPNTPLLNHNTSNMAHTDLFSAKANVNLNNVNSAYDFAIYSVTYGGGESGYEKYRNNKLIQWGVTNASASGESEITMHLPFKDMNYSVFIEMRETGDFFHYAIPSGIQKFKVRVKGANGNFYGAKFQWRAYGYYQ